MKFQIVKHIILLPYPTSIFTYNLWYIQVYFSVSPLLDCSVFNAILTPYLQKTTRLNEHIAFSATMIETSKILNKNIKIRSGIFIVNYHWKIILISIELIKFYPLWNYKKSYGFLMISGRIEVN